MTKARKTPKTWIDAGLKALSKQGVDGTRAETLARSLGATKGSFYWHFKDVPDFHAALLAAWAEGVEKRFNDCLDDDAPANQKLRGLARFVPTPLDRAVRAWALHDARPRKAVARMDKMMLDVIEAQLAEMDATHPDFPGLVLASVLQANKGNSQTETLVDLLLMLK